ncbi:MAG: RNA methyltransferase [Thermoplasmata archaeon]
MSQFQVLLVNPKVDGNVGAIARSMANFDLDDLVLVGAQPPGEDAYRRAKHGRHIVEGAGTVSTLKEALQGSDLSVGTTGIVTRSAESFHRHALSPRELGSRLSRVEGRVSLVFGREDQGLGNDELGRLDLVVNIPCSPAYPVMNVSHAAAVLFYELYRSRASGSESPRPLASGFEKEMLVGALRELLSTTQYPQHKRRRTEVLFRRLLGRALPTKWEFHALMGVLRRASKTIRRQSGSRGPGPSS